MLKKIDHDNIAFSQHLDYSYEPFKIGEYEYSAGHVMRACSISDFEEARGEYIGDDDWLEDHGYTSDDIVSLGKDDNSPLTKIEEAYVFHLSFSVPIYYVGSSFYYAGDILRSVDRKALAILSDEFFKLLNDEQLQYYRLNKDGTEYRPYG